jgi:uridine kinase
VTSAPPPPTAGSDPGDRVSGPLPAGAEERPIGAPVPGGHDELVARVVLLAGPSGSGKSHLAERAALPTVCLDDFYKDGDDPTLPTSDLGIPDWDHPAAWDADRAMAALTALCRTGSVDLPVYALSRDRTVGTRRFDLGGAGLVVAEGIFAAELIAPCRAAGILSEALCLVHRPSVTFWRRLVRDLREGRKSPVTLLRRGLALRRQEPAIVARQVALGARPIHSHDALRRLQRLAATAPTRPEEGLAA